MLAWMTYVVIVTLLLSVAALAAERMTRLKRMAGRWIWIGAIVASVLVPASMALAPLRLLVPVTSPQTQSATALREFTADRVVPVRWIYARTGGGIRSHALDGALRQAWIATSATLVLILAASGVHLGRRKRQWTKTTLLGTPVHVAADVGPAVIGLIRSSIVVPSWLVGAPRTQQAVVLAHERSHCEAGDPQIFGVATALLVLLPWNLPLWWLVRRLRRAIEVDCDERVLRSGHDARQYGETLIAVSQRRSGLIGIVTAMSEPQSFLEARIKIMTSKPVRSWRLVSILLGGLCFGLVALATQVSPPANATDAANPRLPVALNPEVLEGYAGYYQYADNSIVTVEREGTHLIARFSGGGPEAIYPQSATMFLFASADARLSFVVDGRGKATSAVFQQNGGDITMPRVDASRAKQIQASTRERVAQRSPASGSEAALRGMIGGIIAGKVDGNTMYPHLAGQLHKDLPKLQTMLAELGAVLSMKLVRVDDSGLDVFDITHEHGVAQWSIALDSKGMITGAMVPPF